MDNTPLPAIVGELVQIGVDGYKFGAGSLVLRVAEVAHAPEHGWLLITGQEIGWDGRRIGERTITAERTAVRLVRHPG
jgi:hypothetical protein